MTDSDVSKISMISFSDVLSSVEVFTMRLSIQRLCRLVLLILVIVVILPACTSEIPEPSQRCSYNVRLEAGSNFEGGLLSIYLFTGPVSYQVTMLPISPVRTGDRFIYEQSVQLEQMERAAATLTVEDTQDIDFAISTIDSLCPVGNGGWWVLEFSGVRSSAGGTFMLE
jgi:hypothetical protein